MGSSDDIDFQEQQVEELIENNEEVPVRGETIANLVQLARQLGYQFSEHLSEPNPPRDLVRGDFDRIVGSWGRQNGVVPIGEEDGKVVVATSNPLNFTALDELRLSYGKPLEIIVTTNEEVASAINAIRSKLMKDRASVLDTKNDDHFDDSLSGQLKIDVTDAEDDDAPIIRYVNSIIFRANSERASDIHIEPYENCVKVRFRVDGVLKDVAVEDKVFQAAILSRIKVMAGLNIAEKRLPQDGRIGLKIAGKDVDIRVSTVPTQFGERVVMRLLDKSSGILSLEELGITGENLKTINSLITRPHGIILVTGPTGSGKSTTLYACISKINSPQLNILTVEDPVEYQIEGIGQMQVNPKINFTFASGLRSILRQDPDVVMVGEIRDAETAEIAIQASLTGHLVLSTLHTNDSVSAITRLIDIGIEPFLVSSSLLAVMAQRLVRRVCKHCSEEYQITEEELRELDMLRDEYIGHIARKAREGGCEKCQFTGYLGRTGIHELLVLDDEFRSAILQNVEATFLKGVAIKKGMKTLRMDGAEKVLRGITTVEEVLRVTLEAVNGK